MSCAIAPLSRALVDELLAQRDEYVTQPPHRVHILDTVHGLQCAQQLVFLPLGVARFRDGTVKNASC